MGSMSREEYLQSVVRHQSQEIRNLKMEVKTAKLELDTEKLKYERRLGVLAEIASESRRQFITGPSKDDMLDSLRYSLMSLRDKPKPLSWWGRIKQWWRNWRETRNALSNK